MGKGKGMGLLSQAGYNLDAPVFHAPHREDAVSDGLELVGLAAHHHDLEAKVVGQVNVQRRPDALTKLVLELSQLLTEITNVVVVNERQRTDGLDPLCDLRSAHLAPGEIAQQLGACAAALLHERIELPEQ